MILKADMRMRSGETQSQIGLTGPQRREDMRGVFAVVNAGEVAGREVLLVNDLYTAGTTATECAKGLRRAGSSEGGVATVARRLNSASKYEDIPVGFKVSRSQGFGDPDSVKIAEMDGFEALNET